MKLVPCLLFKRPEDSLSAARRRRRRELTPSDVRVLSSRKCGFGVLEASCGVPETSLLRFEGSAEFCAGCQVLLIEACLCNFVRLAS